MNKLMKLTALLVLLGILSSCNALTIPQETTNSIDDTSVPNSTFDTSVTSTPTTTDIPTTSSPITTDTTTASTPVETPSNIFSPYTFTQIDGAIKIEYTSIHNDTYEFGYVVDGHFYEEENIGNMCLHLANTEKALGIRIHSLTLKDWSSPIWFTAQGSPGITSSIEYYCTAENDEYVSVDGVIFTKDMKTLVAFPPGRGGSYSIPEGVEIINNTAFGNSAIEHLILPSSLKTIGDALIDARALEIIEFSDTLPDIGELGVYYAYFTQYPYRYLKFITAVYNGSDAEFEDSKHYSIAATVTKLGAYTNGYVESNGVLTIKEGVRSLYELNLDALSNKTFDKVVLPSTIKSVSGAYKLNTYSFEISADNMYFNAIDGVIYSKRFHDSKDHILVAYPRLREGSYTVVDNTQWIAPSAFRNSNIEELYVYWPWSIGYHAFEGCSKFKKISVYRPETLYLYLDESVAEGFTYEIRYNGDLNAYDNYFAFLIQPDGSHHVGQTTFAPETNAVK